MERLIELSSQVIKLYEELDGIQKDLPTCGGCRECCNTPSVNIEATVLEFIPLAIHLLQNDSIEKWLEILENVDELDRCVLFDPHSERGGCSYHSFRPLVCRLFSGSYVLRKEKPEVWGCKYLKPVLSSLIESLPNCSEVYSKLLAIDFFLAQERYPINIALKKALEYVYYRIFPVFNFKNAWGKSKKEKGCLFDIPSIMAPPRGFEPLPLA
ncbi:MULTISPECIES: YkgJ family cysteine cluster protein [unclassified Thermotoga]|uniref:YkgJ family cysteine cluster protein n=1 Tax=unclassified Thermotoga TaxID=2631113 RepID=UPI0009DE46D3|nr:MULTISPECIES: YkgJ family cysteine cluster protein [unclassified Thermotoga]